MLIAVGLVRGGRASSVGAAGRPQNQIDEPSIHARARVRSYNSAACDACD
jgi:hypothetical protein